MNKEDNFNDFDKKLEKVEYNFPSDVKEYLNEFIVFFSDEKDPKIIYHSIDPKKAYNEAYKIYAKTKRLPTVVRIVNQKDNLAKSFISRI